jgi:alpha-tubulin suppressor-like RCC1 family protein
MSNNKIRKITSAGVVTTLAGSGSTGASDGLGTAASFNMPEGLVVDGIGNVYVADTYNNKIRKITPSGVVTTIAGTGTAASINGNGTSASFWTPRTIVLDNSGNFYISDFRKLRKMSSTGVVTDFAGSGLPGCIDGQASSATIDLARGLATNTTGELIYFSETNFNKIRRVLSCNSTAPQSPVATITQPTTTTPTGVITITSPIGAFEYSIDNINYQSSTVFNNVTPGNYNVTARKSASIGCVSVSTNLTVNPAPSQSGSMKIAGGSGHTLLVCSDNSLWAFGYNYFGQLGNGTNTSTKTPVQITSINDIKAVASSGLHSIVLKNDGTVWAFGKNNSGQLGTGNLLNSNTPVQVTTLSNIIEIAVGYQHSLAVKNDGTVWAWGRNDNGQLGIGNYTDQSLPYQIGSLTNGSAVSAAFDHSLVLKNDGTVWSFGRNYFGQLGNGSNTISNIPVNVFNLSSIISIAAGNQRSIALKSNGTVWAWGRNDNGEHGDGTTTNVNIPVQTSVLNNITKIVTKENSSFALKNDGSVWAWGSNIYNELGIGTTNYNNIPLSINSLTNISDIETGIGHAFAVSSSGIVWAWGSNSDGEIGNGSTTNVYTTPITVSGFCGNQIGIMEINQNNSVTIYPNPNSGVFKIKSDLPSIAATIKIYNTHSQIIYETTQFVEEIDLSNQPKGVYFLQVTSHEGIIYKKLILQ